MAPGETSEHEIASAAAALQQEARFSAQLLRRHGWRLLLVFVGLALPLWGFAELAEEIHQRDVIGFDEPILHFARDLAGAGFDRAFGWISQVGHLHGVVPFDVALVLALTLLRRFREATFAGFALAGSGLLNMAVKQVYARERPSLWTSIAPETTFSFPSGHAMGSATLGCVVVLLAWHTRWRWPVLAVAVPSVLLVGFSRVYLGVHYPSDILAGWAAAIAWTAAVYLVVYRVSGRPWAPTAPWLPR